MEKFSAVIHIVVSDDILLLAVLSSSNLYSCHGIPGCGKTILASTIVDELCSSEAVHGHRVVYYYCDYVDQRTLQTNRIIGTLLRQFFVDDHIPKEIEARIPLGYGEGGQTLEVNELIDLLCLALKLSGPTFIVLDGLDECDKEPRQQIITLLNRLSELDGLIAKPLILCRDEDQLLRSLQWIPQIRITPSALESDIESFVTGSVRTKLQSGELKIRNPSLENEIITELISKAHGMFLWVFFQLDDLCEAPSDAIIRETLRNLPDGLVETYERILTKIGRNAVRSNIARKVFVWTVCAQRPMKTEEVREAVAFELSDKSWDLDRIPDDDLMIES